jgi:hypothetical protein
MQQKTTAVSTNSPAQSVPPFNDVPVQVGPDASVAPKTASVDSINTEVMMHIQQEEMYRREVQKHLEDTTTPSGLKKLTTFLNTPFCLWVLSSIVLALVAHSYAIFASHLDDARHRNESIGWLDLEIKHHIETFKRYTEADSPGIFKGYPARIYAEVLLGNLAGTPANYFSIFPSAANRTLHSLMYELAIYVDDQEQKKQINDAAEAALALSEYIILLRDRYDAIKLNRDNYPGVESGTDNERKRWDEESKQLRKTITEHTAYKNIVLPRWRKLQNGSTKVNEVKSGIS